MAHKTRTAQVLDVVKVLAWVVIAISLVKFAFFPAAQEDESSDGMDPGGSFGQMTTEVGRADITNTVSVTGTIQADEPVVARATLDGNVVRTFVNDGDKVSKGDSLVQIRKEIPGETRQVTDEDGNVSVETADPTYKYETVVSPGDGTVSTSVLVGQQFAIGDTVATVAPSTFSAVASLSADQMYRLQDAPSTATVTIKNGPAPFECSGVKLVSPTGKQQDPKANSGSDNGTSSSTDLKARCAIPADQTVFAGLQVTLEMTAGSATGVLAVPISAVEGRYQSGYVYFAQGEAGKPDYTFPADKSAPATLHEITMSSPAAHSERPSDAAAGAGSAAGVAAVAAAASGCALAGAGSAAGWAFAASGAAWFEQAARANVNARPNTFAVFMGFPDRFIVGSLGGPRRRRSGFAHDRRAAARCRRCAVRGGRTWPFARTRAAAAAQTLWVRVLGSWLGASICGASSLAW